MCPVPQDIGYLKEKTMPSSLVSIFLTVLNTVFKTYLLNEQMDK